MDCMWGSPEGYSHIATEKKRAVTITWQGDAEVENYENLREKADVDGVSPADLAKILISELDQTESKPS